MKIKERYKNGGKDKSREREKQIVGKKNSRIKEIKEKEKRGIKKRVKREKVK